MPTTHAYNVHIQSRSNGNQHIGSFRIYHRHILHMIIEFVVRGAGGVSWQDPGREDPGRKEPQMCDFSLQSVRSRSAKVGDKLVTRDFGTGTRGFAASDDLGMAVCLLPGTELAFAGEVACLPEPIP